jgi:hypothetical protein
VGGGVQTLRAAVLAQAKVGDLEVGEEVLCFARVALQLDNAEDTSGADAADGEVTVAQSWRVRFERGWASVRSKKVSQNG